MMRVAKGDVFSLRTAGGGGFGDPAKRDPAAITADIADGYVTADGALSYRRD
jgi:N-methylhydantoinase B